MWKPDFRSSRMNRRDFLRLSSRAIMGATAGTLPLLRNNTLPYIVGLGRSTDAYEATIRAISYTNWNPLNIVGKNVLIKPNLVQPNTGSSGVVTEPEVVRAVVDLCIDAGAASILIIETSHVGAYFTECGYDFFNSYHPSVALADIANLPYSLASAPGGTAYNSFYLPDVVQDANSYLISVAKLKVHNLAVVTLATKNLFGLPPVAPYETPPRLGRFGIHDRSFHQATVDLSLARPADFSVVDGIWGMEQFGPWGGIPRQMNVVVAGDNSLAVDDVCMLIMGVPTQKVMYMLLAAASGLGPTNLSQISIQGDGYEPTTFLLPPELPMATPPKATPFSFNPSANETVDISFKVNKACGSYVEIVEVSPYDTVMTQVRMIRGAYQQPAGPDMVSWDGRNNAGEIVPAKAYGIRVTVQGYDTTPRIHAFGWVTVQAN